MENSSLRRRVLMEIENLVASSCPKQKVPQKFENLHVAILKNHYNATDVIFDYHRKRVVLDIVMDDRDYDPKTINLYIPTLHANLWFRNLYDFLQTCIDRDSKSVAFYAGLLQSYQNNGMHLVV
ncbi:hypothetical protein SAMN05421636_101277 [Pricia antarctica]|uniref:Uncharacterized protein n=1 Tax=Pricia antarctica TaxID=641691 RepID=A0A1G6WDJ0_9FLAO|nr:hypothetical protein [Pricia antarctica]SDD63912.1 hypothetical protein SAMN05421636_101277 [Pricia antarctica]